MSITIEFSNPDKKESGTLKVIVSYKHGDHNVSASHLTCVVDARNYAKRIINILEKKRLAGEQDGS